MGDELDPAAVAEVERILSHSIAEGSGLDAILKPLYELAVSQGWTWMGIAAKRQFNPLAAMLYKARSYSSYCEVRLAQLREGNFERWVYKSDPDCPEAHGDLDGLAFTPDHPFWRCGYPPHDWHCGCYVVGAGSEAAVGRLGGDLNKAVPQSWVDFERGKDVAGFRSGWRETASNVRELLGLVRSGDYPQE